jgi:acetyl esterase
MKPNAIPFILLLFSYLTTFAQNQPPTVEQVRAAMQQEADQIKRPLEAVFRTEVRKIKSGTDSVAIQIYYPNNKQNLPILYHIHGGAFVMRALDENASRILCNRTGSVVVAVDYRVAPEHPFPASVDDCYAVWQWISRNAATIQGNDKKITLLGNSAGGTFAAVLQVKQQQNNEPKPPVALVLVNPGVDLRPTAPGIDYYGLVVGWYLNRADPTQPLASPVLDTYLKDYPKTLIITCEKDEIRQHGLMLAEKLKATGVKIQHTDLPKLPHLGADWGAASPLAKPAMEAVVQFLNSDKDVKKPVNPNKYAG